MNQPQQKPTVFHYIGAVFAIAGVLAYLFISYMLGLPLILFGVALIVVGTIQQYLASRRPVAVDSAQPPPSRVPEGVSAEHKKIVLDLIGDGLNEEEVVWYASNMHGMSEQEARDALAMVQSSAVVPTLQQKISPQPSVSDVLPTLKDNGYWVAFNALFISLILAGISAYFFVIPGLEGSFSARTGVTTSVAVFIAVAMLVWAMLQQLPVAPPADRWLFALRPVFLALYVCIVQVVIYAFVPHASMPDALAFGVSVSLSLLIFLLIFWLREWFTIKLAALFLLAYLVVGEWLASFYFGLINAAMSGTSLYWPSLIPGYIAEAQVPNLLFILLLSAVFLALIWVLVNIVGKEAPRAKSRAAGENRLKSLPGRLVRGELGLAKSFWYLGVLAGFPFTLAIRLAEITTNLPLAVAGTLLGAAFYGFVTFVVWRAGKFYSGARGWLYLAYVLLVLQLVSMLSLFGLLIYVRL